MTRLHDFITEQEQEFEHMVVEPAPSGEWYKYNYEYHAQSCVMDTLYEVAAIVGSCRDCKHQLNTKRGDGYRDCRLGNGVHKKEWYCADFENKRLVDEN